MKTFTMKHRFAPKLKEETFNESNAPTWLTSEDTIKGSTMDGRWFWTDHVLNLDINESINTDFRTITRLT